MIGKKNIINLIKINNRTTILELSVKCNVTRLTIIRDLKKLRKLKIIKRIGSDKTGYWKISKA